MTSTLNAGDFITYHKLGYYRGSPRLFIESPRLQQLGFVPRTFLDVDCSSGLKLMLRPSSQKTKNRVSFRQLSGLDCPIIDINNKTTLAHFADHTELKIRATQQQLIIEPTIKSFNILKHRTAGIPISAVEYFAGGSTLSQAITDDPRFKLEAAVEISSKFASHFAVEHPEVTLFQSDIRDVNPQDMPDIGFMFASLPCTCFSNLGIAKKQLKATGSEVGDTGDLFLSFLHHVNHHMPLAVMVENVPNFFGDNAIAGRLMMKHLERIGYHVNYFELQPHAEWNEPQDRRRGVMVATLYGKFYPSIPMVPFQGSAGDFLDQPDPIQDRIDADAIKASITGRIKHQARHKAAGNGFGFSTINANSKKIPTICRSYWKVNAGPFVETPYGLRLLRQGEMEKIMGFKPNKGFTSKSYSTAVEILGQGVQTRIFKQLINQLGDFLEYKITNKKIPVYSKHEQIS